MQTDSPIPMDIPSFQARRSWKCHIIVISTILLVSITALSFNEIFFSHAQFADTRTIEIPQGFGSRMIADKLKAEGFVRSKWAFVTYVSLRGEASSLKPGTYEFTDAAIPEIAAELIKGTTKEIVITLPEGSNANDLADILTKQGLSAGNTFAQFATGLDTKTFASIYPFLSRSAFTSGLEGYLFPDTYHVYKDANQNQIADIFLQNFDKKVTPDMRSTIADSGKTLHDIIIMASLIEKEVVSDQDRAVVSGILWNRLRINMPLQVDATINYIKKQNGHTPSSNGKISLADLKLNSPYNTYKYRGLPAGPIGNPGLSAIQAAIHPTPSGYLYYLSTPEGKTIYSKTLTEHNTAKFKYLK
ncbi:MAG: endolytic transglycosylase MltG [bacterium]|nr:endolytic transglycosylase MltG [bacterium]MDZ4285434.1 endolytic transglycosylase MltG [Candidatus Sungbacteria bacterium]